MRRLHLSRWKRWGQTPRDRKCSYIDLLAVEKVLPYCGRTGGYNVSEWPRRMSSYSGIFPGASQVFKESQLYSAVQDTHSVCVDWERNTNFVQASPKRLGLL